MRNALLIILTVFLSNNFTFGQETDCSRSDGTFTYYATLIISSVPNDFNKNDFINHIVDLDDLSSQDLIALNEHITEVYKSFPTAETEFLQRVVSISATLEIYSILAELTNSIEHHECTEEAILPGLNKNENIKNVIVYPNPITENSVIEFQTYPVNINLEIVNDIGQTIYKEHVFDKRIVDFKNIKWTSGVYYLKLSHLNNGQSQILRILKE